MNYQPVTVDIRERFEFEIMASSVADANSQQGGKKGKDKNKDFVGHVKERLVEVNNTMSAPTGMVDNMDRGIEGLESEGDIEELRGEMQTAMTSVVTNFKGEIQAL